MSRRVAEQFLHKKWQQDSASIEHKAYNRHQECADRIGSVAEYAEIDNRMLSFQLANDQATQSHYSEHRQRDDEMRAEPVFLLALIEHDLKRSHPQHE